jgi:hypothetical protein
LPISSASISDIAGLDPKIHADKALNVISEVRSCLREQNPAKQLNFAPYIQRRYLMFSAQLPVHARLLRISPKLLRTWKYALDLQTVMAGWIHENP